MQRKSNILISSRDGMAMIMAISVIVVVSTILMAALSLTAKTTKSSTDVYLYEQANLLVRSAGEYAKIKIAKAEPCTYFGESFIENDIYNITISVRYANKTCSTEMLLTQKANFAAAMIDITAEVNDPTITTENIRIFKRKLIEL